MFGFVKKELPPRDLIPAQELPAVWANAEKFAGLKWADVRPMLVDLNRRLAVLEAKEKS